MIGLLGGINGSKFEGKTEVVYPASSNNYTERNKSSTLEFSAGAFSRYYKMIGTSRFAVFGELAATYGSGKSKNTYEPNGVSYPETSGPKFSSFNVVIRPGLTYFFTKTIAAEAFFGNVGYFYTKNEGGQNNSSSSTYSGFNSRLNFSLSNISLGINFYFGGKKV